MMDHESQLKLQAYVDGELSPAEALEMERSLANDSEVQHLAEWVRTMRAAMRDAELDRKLPESRDFFWSKIERQISRQPSTAREAGRTSFATSFRRLFNPIAAFAAVIVIVVFAMLDTRSGRWRGPEVEASLADPGALTYRDYPNGTTLVWLTYPADSDYE